jgi:hypothetical protein
MNNDILCFKFYTNVIELYTHATACFCRDNPISGQGDRKKREERGFV